MGDTKRFGDILQQMSMGMEPFDHRKHKPQDVGLGGPSTEYLLSVDMGMAPDGFAPADIANIPSIWWDKDGKPHLIDDPDMALQMALQYEETTGKRFPRYNDMLNEPNPYSQAEEAAQHRSAMGGATSNPLARYSW